MCQRCIGRAAMQGRLALRRSKLPRPASRLAIVPTRRRLSSTQAAHGEGSTDGATKASSAQSGVAQAVGAQLATPAPAASDTAQGSKKSSSGGTEIMSSCLEGTKMRGLNYLKNRSDPVAGADSEYPQWLWNCLDAKEGKGQSTQGGGSAGDEYGTLASSSHRPLPKGIVPRLTSGAV